ncbi:MAG: type IV pilus assembly protein PilM [Planctomycetes bacterium]|nr:type IV pilus assembly protein PilM [Planctomycetota bacterium]
MATTQAVWGIDVGRCALKAIKLRAGAEGQVEVVAHDYVEHAKILSQPDADRHELIAAALEKFLSRNDITKDRVVVSVPGQHTLARFTKLPPVAPKRIPDIVRYEADQQIPFDMDEVIWDYQTFEQEGLPDLEVGIFAMKRELLREHLLHFEQAAIEPIAVQSVPLAVYNAAHFDGLLGKETTILLDIGAENSDLVVATPNSLWTRTIPLGGNSFTEALVKSFKLSFAKAETLKRTAETSKYRRQIFQAMRPIFADVVQELQRSIGFYSSTHRDAEINKVVAMGNAFKLPGLQKYLQQNLGMDVETPAAFAKVSPSDAASAETLKSELLSFFTAYGLALQGLELTKVTSNLLPTELAKQVVWRKKRPAFAAAAACLVLAGGTIWFRQTADMRALAAAPDEGGGAKNWEAAAETIDRGAPGSASDIGKAVALRDAGKTLKAELEKLRGQGKNERADAEKLLKLQRNKLVVPRVVKLVHDSLPVPDGPLADADTPQKIVAALEAGAAPRGERKQIVIESLDIQFEQDVHTWLSPEDAQAINDVNKDLPGLWLKITCTTPNQGAAKFITDAFLTPLKENGRKPKQGFYIDRVHIASGGKADAKTPGARGGAKPSTAAAGTDRFDVVTNESTDQDWRFEIYVDVITENFPEGGVAEKPAAEPKDTAQPRGKDKGD